MSGWKMFGFGLLAVIAMSVAWLYIRPYFHTYPEQDECSFGPVSNERYRELLAEAKRRQASGEWPRLSGYNREMSANLQKRFDDLTEGVDSLHERIAAMHAVGRALGANYRMTDFGEADPFAADRIERAQGKERAQVVFFTYILDVHRVGGFAPIMKEALIHFRYLIDGSYDPTPQINDTFTASVRWPFINFDRPPTFGYPVHHADCPAVPSEEWFEAYRDWLSDQAAVGDQG